MWLPVMYNTHFYGMVKKFMKQIMNGFISKVNAIFISKTIMLRALLPHVKAIDKSNYLPVTEKMANGIFSLPLYPKLKKTDVFKISRVIKKILLKI